MTYKEKLKQDTGLDVNGAGCPCDHGYEERPCFYTHCTSMTCEECWNREMKEKENGNMKYKVVDTVLIQGVVTEVEERKGDDFHTKVKFHALSDMMFWFKDDEIFELPKPDKTYEHGLQDAWELARKLVYCVENGGFTADEMNNIFGLSAYTSILRRFTPQEALAKLKAYEKSKEIKVGDVVEHMKETDGFVGVVIDQYADDRYYILTENGCVEDWCRAEIGKTDKHIDIAGLLEQIKGE